MNNPTPLTCLLSLSLLTASAATFTVTPNLVNNDYTGLITFQMSGLSPGETVQVVQFYDSNSNGVADSPDLAVRGETVIDGQAQLVNGATNVNVLRDEDGATNGAIRGSLRFAFAPELARGVGSYLFRFSSPSNHFPVSTVPFTVVSAPYLQKVQGTVKCNGTNVPYAVVALIQIRGGGVQVIVGSAADAAGNYTLKAPPDSYAVIASWPGYVTDFTAAPLVTLAPSATITTNLNLIPATTTLAGKLVDSDNPALPAVPYCQMVLVNTNLFFTIALADSNANFNVPVTPGSWILRPVWQSAAANSYLVPRPDPFMEAHFDTTVGPVTGAALTFKRATSLIYGTVEDNHSNAIAGITLSASADGGAFDAFGLSDTNGLYSLASDPGGGYVEVQDLSKPPAGNYLWTGIYFGLSDEQALSLDVIGVVPTAHFSGHILDDTGAPVGGLDFFADGTSATLTGTSLALTDTNGFFDLPVFGGAWTLLFDSQLFPALVFPTDYSFHITDAIDVTNIIIIAQRVTGSISGYVRDQSNGPISALEVTCSMTVGATNHRLSAYTDPTGAYSFPVSTGTWNVSLRPYDLLSLGYNLANPVNVMVPPASGIASFILLPMGPASGPPGIATRALPDAFLGQAYYQALAVTNSAKFPTWSISSGLLPDGLRQDPDSHIGSISGTPTRAGRFDFTALVTDSRGSNATCALSINVRSAPPQAPTLDLPALLPGNIFRVRVTGAAQQSYTLQFATTLTNWTDTLVTNAPGNVFYLQDPLATNTSRLYRLRVNP